MKFKHPAARNYAAHLRSRLGKPDDETRDSVIWYEPTATIAVKDEYVKHDFPKPHHDFVYTTAKSKLTPRQASRLPFVTGSIIWDGLKQEATARCGDVTANAVTLSFVDDQPKLAHLSPAQLKAEYGRRINNLIVNKRWQWLAALDQ
jgi:hypothetical protein